MRNIEPSPNRLLWKFSEVTAPAEWQGKTAKRMYERALQSEEPNGGWIENAVQGSMRIALKPPQDSEMVPYGMSEQYAETHVKRHIAKLRAKADRLERILAVYSGRAFIVQPEAIGITHPFPIEQTINSILRQDPTHIWIHGVRWEKDRQGRWEEVQNA